MKTGKLLVSWLFHGIVLLFCSQFEGCCAQGSNALVYSKYMYDEEEGEVQPKGHHEFLSYKPKNYVPEVPFNYEEKQALRSYKKNDDSYLNSDSFELDEDPMRTRRFKMKRCLKRVKRTKGANKTAAIKSKPVKAQNKREGDVVAENDMESEAKKACSTTAKCSKKTKCTKPCKSKGTKGCKTKCSKPGKTKCTGASTKAAAVTSCPTSKTTTCKSSTSTEGAEEDEEPAEECTTEGGGEGTEEEKLKGDRQDV